jgi:hypothetical protein
MARIEQKTRIRTARARIGPAPVIGPAIANFGKTLGGIAASSLADKRIKEATLAAEKLVFERDDKGNIRPPQLPQANGFFGPTIFDEQYTEELMVRYRQQIELDGRAKYAELAGRHQFDPDGYAAAAEGYRSTVVDSALPQVQSSVDIALQSVEVGHFNTITRQRAERDRKFNAETHLVSIDQRMKEVDGVITSMPDDFEAQATAIAEVVGMINYGTDKYYSEGQAQIAIDGLNQRIATGRLALQIDAFPDTQTGRAELMQFLLDFDAGKGEITLPTETGTETASVLELYPSQEDREQITLGVKQHIAAVQTSELAVIASVQAAEFQDAFDRWGKFVVTEHLAGRPVGADVFDVATSAAIMSESGEVNGQMLSFFLGLSQSNQSLLASNALRNENAILTNDQLQMIEAYFPSMSPEVQEIANGLAQTGSIGASGFMSLLTGDPDSLPPGFTPEMRLRQAEDILSTANRLAGDGHMTKAQQRFFGHIEGLDMVMRRNVAQWEKRNPGKTFATDATNQERQVVADQTRRENGRFPMQQTVENAEVIDQYSGVDPDAWADPTQDIKSLLDRVSIYTVIPQSAADFLVTAFQDPANLDPAVLNRGIELVEELKKDPVMYGNLDEAVGNNIARGIRGIMDAIEPAGRRNTTQVQNIMERAQTDKSFYPQLRDLDREQQDEIKDNIKQAVDSSMVGQQLEDRVAGMSSLGYDLTDSGDLDAATAVAMRRMMLEDGWALSTSAAEDAFARHPDANFFFQGTRAGSVVNDRPSAAWSQFPIEFFVENPTDLKAVYATAERMANDATGLKFRMNENLGLQFNGTMIDSKTGIELPNYVLMFRSEDERWEPLEDVDFTRALQTTFRDEIIGGQERRRKRLEALHFERMTELNKMREARIRIGTGGRR